MDEKPKINLSLTIKIPPNYINYPRISKYDFFSTPPNKNVYSEIVLVKNQKRKRDDDIIISSK